MKAESVAFWILFAVTVVVYGAMVLWSLPRIAAAAGGLAPFDMRPTGYSFDEAKGFLAALSPDGFAFYLGVQGKLDAIYPALLAATLFFAIATLVPMRLGVWRWVLALIAIPGAVFDYLENAAVSAMLTGGADGLTTAAVSTADRWTVLKSAFTAVAMITLVLLLVGRLVRRLLWRRSSAT
jgi:hypothetical protein